MYVDFKKGCTGVAPEPRPKPDSNPEPVVPITVPTPPVPTPTPPAPTPKKYVPAPSPKKYVPPEDNKGSSSNTPGNDSKPDYDPDDSSSSNKKYVPPESRGSGGGVKKHHFRNFILICLVGAGAYWIYKRRTEFDYSRFRMSRSRNFTPSYFGGSSGYDSSGMYDNLSMTDFGDGRGSQSTSSFQPVSLPSAPSAYVGGA